MTHGLSTFRSRLGIPADDLDRCHDLLGRFSWLSLAGQRILMTGGTGFVGKWLLATLLDANEVFGLNCLITVVSRNPSAFQCDWPELAGQVTWISADIRDLKTVDCSFDIVIHAAAEIISDAKPVDLFLTCVDGTRQVLSVARSCGARKLLLVSSGAIYGSIPEGMTHVPETYVGGPDPLLSSSAYAEGKRAAEWLAIHSASDGLDIKIARLFTAVGPHLPLDKHFAIGNFLGAALNREPIVIKGDGSPERSYLYAADMAAWLWAVLIRGKSGRAYNVGATEAVSIAELARRINAALAIDLPIKVIGHVQIGQHMRHYVPDTLRARHELGLPDAMSLHEAILRTARWHQLRYSPTLNTACSSVAIKSKSAPNAF